MERTAFVMIHCAVSPMPIGRTPGFLSKAIRRLARSGAVDDGSTYDVQSRLATDARDSQRSHEAPLWLVHRRLHSRESRPEGPAAPFTFRAAARMTFPSMDSNITGWGSSGSSGTVQEGNAG